MIIEDIVDLDRYPMSQPKFGAHCRTTLDRDGVLVLSDFIQPSALAAMLAEAEAGQDKAYFCASSHSVYLTPPDPLFAENHPANRKMVSSKGCICDDLIGTNSPLRTLYDDTSFRNFIASVTGQTELHPYADSLSSINIHYANRDQELGWHFDNSSFAITLLIQKPPLGSHFEYVKNLRSADIGDMNFEGVKSLLNGDMRPETLSMEAGTLVLFRGRNSIHRVSPNESDTTRMLAVLAYNTEAGVALSETARMTFYGRLN